MTEGTINCPRCYGEGEINIRKSLHSKTVRSVCPDCMGHRRVTGLKAWQTKLRIQERAESLVNQITNAPLADLGGKGR